MKITSLRYRTFLFLLIIFAILPTGCKSKSTSPGTSAAAQTDNIRPTVTSFSPTGTDVPTTVTTITATFSELMEHALLSTNTFIVIVDGKVVPGNITATDNLTIMETTATFNPTSGSLASGKTHAVSITTAVEDLAMNKMATSKTWSFTMGTIPDETLPTFAGISSATATSTTTISLSWNAATDDTTPPNQIRYEICQSTVLDECIVSPFPAASTTVTRFETSGGTTTLGLTGLIKNTTYHFVVRAKDLSNNIDTNPVQKSATTFGDPVPTGDGTLNIAAGQHALNPSIAVVGTIPYLVWEETTGTGLSNVHFRTFDGTNWTTPTAPINASGTSGRQPRVASDRATTPVAFLTYTECDSTGGNCKVFVQKDVGLGNWQDVPNVTPPVPLNIDTTKSATDSAIAFDSSNTPYVIWTELDGSGISQIFVKHFDGASWVSDPLAGTSLNVNSTEDGFNPAIAINGTTIKASWMECVSPNNCQLHIKEWNAGASPPAASDPNFQKVETFPSVPDDPSLAFNNGILYAAWHETGKFHVRREETTGTFKDIEDMGFVVDGSNNTLLFRDVGTTDKTATITPKTYKTGGALATEVKSALESANAGMDTYTVAFDPVTGKFTITNGVTGTTNTNTLDLLVENSGTTAEEILGFNASNITPIPVDGSVTSDFDAKAIKVSPSSNTTLARIPASTQGPYLAFAKVPSSSASPTINRPELFIRLWNNTNSTWTSVVDGTLNMTLANPNSTINASIGVSSTGSVFVAFVEEGICLDPSTPNNNCGDPSPTIPQLYVKQLK
ncbi:MAG: Ig-like domain-containing protein [Nitrospiria bacterium]